MTWHREGPIGIRDPHHCFLFCGLIGPFTALAEIKLPHSLGAHTVNTSDYLITGLMAVLICKICRSERVREALA